MTNLKDIFSSVQSGDIKQTVDLVNRAVKKDYPAAGILREGLVGGMMETERKFYRNEILDSEVLMAEQAMKAGLRLIMPVLEEGQDPSIGTVIIGTMEGDIRGTKKDIISIMMRSLGLKVIDLGISVSNIRFIEAAMEEKAQIIACTTALTTFLPQMKTLVQAAVQANIRGKTKLLFTGGPVTEWFCKSIDADLYAPDLIQAAEIASEYCRKMGSPGNTDNRTPAPSVVQKEAAQMRAQERAQ